MDQNAKKELLRTIKFTLFSISAGVIQILSFTLLYELLKLDEPIAHLISLVLSVLWNFTLNRKFTFQSASNVPLSTWWTAALTGPLGWNPYLVEALTMIVNFVTEFLYQRFFVFGKSIDTAKK